MVETTEPFCPNVEKDSGAFIEKAGFCKTMPKIIACGSREDAFRRFQTALRENKTSFCILLVDSEAPLEVEKGIWHHLNRYDNWDLPVRASEENAQLMVQCMETWLLADGDALSAFYKQGFLPKHLPKRMNSESISKKEVFQVLDQATRFSGTKGAYKKGSHAFKILSLINPEIVSRRAPHAARLLETLKKQSKIF